MSIASSARRYSVKFAAVAVMVMLTSVVILAMRRGPVVINTSDQTQIVLEIPSTFDRWWFGRPAEISLRSASREESIASLLYGTWDRPLLIIENERTKDVLCLYDYDGSIELLVFSRASNGASASGPPSHLDLLVRRARWNVRFADKPDIDALKAWLREADERTVRQQSVATVDIGVYEHYLRADSLESILQRVFPRHEGRWLPNAAGLVRFQ
jgi:hypothetical protein